MTKSYGKSGRHYRYEPTDKKGQGALEFWAENGMICMLDERIPPRDPDHFVVLTVREFLVNLRAINASIQRCANAVARVALSRGVNPGGAATEEREALQKLVEDGIAAAKEAQRMGDPLNPRHAADMIKERRKSMLHAGVSTQTAGMGAGAVSQDIAPEARELPPLILPGQDTPKSDKKLIIP
jgi:hypothetical protein